MVNPKSYRRMTPEQSRRAMKNMIGLHRSIAMAGAIGMTLALGGLALAVLRYIWRMAA